MAQRINYELTCLECGRPTEEDDDGICSMCLLDGRQIKHPPHHLGQPEDGKRLSRRRRPKGHRPNPSKRSIEAVVPKVEVDRGRDGQHDGRRHQPGGGSERRR